MAAGTAAAGSKRGSRYSNRAILRFYDSIYPPAPHWHHALYPYQVQALLAMERGVADCRSMRTSPLTFIYRISRQGGKSSSMGRFLTRLLFKYSKAGGEIVQTAPTRQPQLDICKGYLSSALDTFDGFVRQDQVQEGKQKSRPVYTTRDGYNFHVGQACVHMVSGDPDANAQGHTASILLHVDEAQHFDPAVYRESFRPMLATTNAATIISGSCSTLDSFIEQETERLLLLEGTVGKRLVFSYPWDVVAYYNPAYRAFVENEMLEMGTDHPIFLSQYCLRPVEATGRLFTRADLLKLVSSTDALGQVVAAFSYPRQRGPVDGAFYVAGVDLCGADEQDAEALLSPEANPKRDSTVVTVARLLWKDRTGDTPLPILHVVDHLYLPGQNPEALTDLLTRFLFEKWHCVHVCVDANGVGDSVAATLRNRRPGQVDALKGKASEVGYRLLSAVKSGRLKVYTPEADDRAGRAMRSEFDLQLRYCEKEVSPTTSRLKFGAPARRVPTTTGAARILHDDFPKSLGYCVWAAQDHLYTRTTKARPPKRAYEFGRGLAS